ncbi:DUF4153 domain-containing protein [Sphingomonas sp. SFZ2018-12]|uniref:DUF4153 domain-containing protein n=1 Tax=Sphingomonas sp. SFZ2018-12 TaxID=2683197 RepID=UPI001F0CE99E|nr:DUF4153 domain-containing protein [Sphingomonas sp. SFZ2018-12]MCH4892242.1 DUF4153 domain-containing protein [Sphingomonas sp. SFZ2018-12]
MNEADRSAQSTPAWPARTPLLAGLGLATGLTAHRIVEASGQNPGAVAIGWFSFVVVAAAVIGFTIDRPRGVASLLFGLGCGVIAGLIAALNGPTESWSASEGWRMVSGALAIGIAAPLFQASTRQGRSWPSIAVQSVHDHAWTNAVLFAGSWVFVGIAFLLLLVVSELFHLIGIDLLRDWLRDNAVVAALVGGAFGAGLGLLRDQERVVRLLQAVVRNVLAVLAPMLGAALLIFLGALPFTGVDALWEAWGSAATLLLACAVAALVLVDAVIGNAPEEEARNRALRFGAIALGIVMLPLALLAAFAIGLRVHQYGITPDRLWAISFAALASAYGLAYLVTLVRARTAWMAALRRANLRLAIGTALFALLLATPLAGFNAIAARDQVARLESGRVSAERFDWTALRFDFGGPGRRALELLARGPDKALSARAAAALGQTSRYAAAQDAQRRASTASMARRVRVLPAGTALPDGLRDRLADIGDCGFDTARCTVLFVSPREALVLPDGCISGPATIAACDATRLERNSGGWAVAPIRPVAGAGAAPGSLARDYRAGQLEVRRVERRQLFIGDQPVGAAFE